MPDDPIVIVSAARTPIGSFLGTLSAAKATELGTAAISGALAKGAVSPEWVDQCLMGCVLPSGLGQAPARQAALGAGLPASCGAVTVNKMCGSGMQAVILAHDAVTAKSADLIVAGGMESMSNAPYLLPKHRRGERIGHGPVYDSLYFDGLEDAYTPGKLMGVFADEEANALGFRRETQDDFAIESLRRARSAVESGAFTTEITPVEVQSRDGVKSIDADEQPFRVDPAKIPALKPAFRFNGTITAASSSSISDGAAATIVTRLSVAELRGLTPVARIVAHSTHATGPSLFVRAPVNAIRTLLQKAGWKTTDVDLFEINEAFAMVPMIAMRDLGIEREILNVHGGACALGHPIGATGARIIVTLISALQRRNACRGVASLCIAGGEATAIAIELL